MAAPSIGRFEALDTLRGMLLAIMAVNHIPSVFAPLTQQPFGFATAAEGFVFLAGLVCGLVYSRRWVQKGPRIAVKGLMQRAFVIYKSHLFCVLAIFAWMLLFRCFSETGAIPAGSPRIWFQRPSSWVATLALLNQPGLLDVLPTYWSFMIGTPLILYSLHRGWVKRVLITSAVIWMLTNRFDPPYPTIIGSINTGAFNTGAWQLLYVIGCVCGHAWAHGTLPRWQPRWWTVMGLVAVVVFLSACSHGWLTLGISSDWWFKLTNKNNLAPVRLLNVMVLALLGHLWLRNRRGNLGLPLLAMMGRHSLVVFSIHCVLAIVILGFPSFFESTTRGTVIGPVMMFSVQIATTLVAERYSRKKRDKARPAVSVRVGCL